MFARFTVNFPLLRYIEFDGEFSIAIVVLPSQLVVLNSETYSVYTFVGIDDTVVGTCLSYVVPSRGTVCGTR